MLLCNNGQDFHQRRRGGWCKRLDAVDILHLAKPLSNTCNLSFQYRTVSFRLVSNHPLRSYRFPPFQRCRGFVTTGRFVTVYLNFHGLVPCRFIFRLLYIRCEVQGCSTSVGKPLGMHTLSPFVFPTRHPAIMAIAPLTIQGVRVKLQPHIVAAIIASSNSGSYLY